jgi:alpha-1,3-mannosyltransferase
MYNNNRIRLPVKKISKSCLLLAILMLCAWMSSNLVKSAKDQFVSSAVLNALELSSKNHYCTLVADSAKRYESVSIQQKRYYITANLHESSSIMSDFIIQLIKLVDFLTVTDKTRVFVSIYESGSNDQTKTNLYLLSVLLESRGVKHSIQGGDEKLDFLSHRIEFLANMRNRALESLSSAVSGGPFDKIIFLNDVFFCADDVKELIHQSLLQNADLTCGLDFDTEDSSKSNKYLYRF